MRSKTDFEPIRAADFQARTDIDLAKVEGGERVEWIISPRDIVKVETVQSMPDWYRDQLLSSIGVGYNRDRKVYRGLGIHLRGKDPSDLLVGQKYVYRSNYMAIVESFREIFKGYGMPRGFAQAFACLLFGKGEGGQEVLGHYLPPIVEIHNGENILLDGVHRNYLTRAAGVNIQCLVIEGVSLTFPCAPHPWKDVKPADEKPSRVEDRYWDLDRDLFRDLKYVGIDG